MKKFNLKRIAKDALLLALLVVCAWISFPFMASVVTLQVFGVILVILLAESFDSIIIIFVYCLMGTCGLPVFSGGSSGFASITYGFIVGFLVASIIIYVYKILFNRKREEKLIDTIIKCIIFEIVIYIFGLSWYTVLSDTHNFFLWLYVFLPYLGIDALKCWIAIMIYRRLIQIFKKQEEENMIDKEKEQE